MDPMRHINLVFLLFLIPATSLVACPPILDGVKSGDDGFTRSERRQYRAAIDRGDAFYQHGFGDMAAADLNYRMALDLSPNDPVVLLKLGLCALNGPHPANALEWLSKAEAIDPDLRHIHFLMGVCLQANGRWDDAMAEFEQHRIALLLTPDPDATFNLVDERIEACKAAKHEMTRADGDLLIDEDWVIDEPNDECAVRQGELNGPQQSGSTTRVTEMTCDHIGPIDAWSAPVASIGSDDGYGAVSMHADHRSMLTFGDASSSGTAHPHGGGWLKLTWSLLPIDTNDDRSQALNDLDPVAMRPDLYADGSKGNKYTRREILRFIKGLHMMEAVEIKLIGMDMQDASLPEPFNRCHGKRSLVPQRSIDRGHDMAVRVDDRLPDMRLAHTEHVGAGMSKVYFASNSVEIDTAFDTLLNELVAELLADPTLHAVINGHADGDVKGSDNTMLSISRANVVKDFLIAHGVAEHRLVTKASAATRPAVPNDSPAHMALNRRTEIMLH